MDGTAGGSFLEVDGLDQDLKFIQLSISGRTTGVITVTAKSDGGHAVEPFSVGLDINLAAGEYTVFPEGAFTELVLTPSIAGDDFVATLNQWLQ